MEKFLVVITALVIFAGSALGQDNSDKMKLLRAENGKLRKQINAMAKRIEAISGGADTKATKTFSIYEKSEQWWRDPSAFAMEFVLREAIQYKFPKESPAQWLARNKSFASSQINWTMRISALSRISKEEAGRQYYAGQAEIIRQKETIEDLNRESRGSGNADRGARPRPPRSADRRSRGNNNRRTQQQDRLREAKQRLAELTKENNRWNTIFQANGGIRLTASFHEHVASETAGETPQRRSTHRTGRTSRQSRRSRRSGSSSRTRRNRTRNNVAGAGKTIELIMDVIGDEATKLDEYLKSKEKKYKESSDDWPIRITGTVSTLTYEDNIIRVFMTEGKWHPAAGKGLTEDTGRSRTSGGRDRTGPGRGRMGEMDEMRGRRGGPPAGGRRPGR